MSRIREFNPVAMETFTSSRLQLSHGLGRMFEGKAWRFTVFLPRWLITDSTRVVICTARDEALLEGLLERHFGGCTIEQSLACGIGRRGDRFEMNLHRKIVVIASRWRGTPRYFQALRRELEECSGEGQILITRQDLVIV